MLFLQPPADATAPAAPRPIAISPNTGLAFERALLTDDRAERVRELLEALAADSGAASWALATAEFCSRRTINRIEDAALWLAGALEGELATSLTVESAGSATTPNDIEWRLPRLVARLTAAQAQAADFERRLEHEKLESLKELAYGASHEINNPLANIAARAQTLLEDEADPERQRKLVAIHRQAMRAHEMISDLMLFARPPKLKLATCDVVAVARMVVDELRELAAERDVQITFEGAERQLYIQGDETQLAVAIGALLKNALETSSDGGQITVTVNCRSIEGHDFAEITVADEGPGMTDEIRRHMFDPFYSGREAGRGLGFGASKCWRIVTDHHGQVEVRKRPQDGTEVVIRLPLVSSEQ
jgi:signal transduction histidine kinase